MCGEDYPSPSKRRRLSYGLQNTQPTYVARARPSGGNLPVRHDAGEKVEEEQRPSNSASLTMAPFLKAHIHSKYTGQSQRARAGTNPAGKDQRPYCYRHRPDLKCRKQPSGPDMDQLQTDLQSLSQTDQQNISNVWTIFSAAPARHRDLMLQGILAQCCFPQLSFMLSTVREMIKIDFLSALPAELGLMVLRNLDTASLCKASQVSRHWHALADSDDVWHRMCEQHIARKCKNCGWGLPLLERKRLMASKHRYVADSGADGSDSDGSQTPAPAPEHPEKSQALAPQSRAVQTRKFLPWKKVYKDRFEIGSNWKHGRYTAREFKGHTNGVLCLQFNDHVLATGSYDTTIKIWDVATGQEIRTLRGHECGVRCLQFDDSKLISGSLDCTIKVWNWRTGECVRTLTGHGGGVLGLHFYDKVLASGSVDHTVNIWDFEGKSRTCLRGHSDWVNSVKVDTASRTVFSASDDLTVRLWDLDTGRTIKTYEGHVGHVQEVLPLSDEFDFDIPDGEPVDRASGAPATDDASAQSSAFATAFADGSARALPPRYMLTAGLDSTIRLWDVHTGRCVRTSFGHVEGIWAVAADPMRIVSGAEDRMLKVWDSRTGKCERTITWHDGPVTAVALNDSRIASGSEDGDVRMLSFNYFRRAGVLAHDCQT